MAAANTHLVKLPEAQGQLLEAWLMDFEQSWHPTQLAARIRELPPPSHPLRLPGLTEMVKIDLERQWQQGIPVSLESYLKQYPELGTADTVSADLIQAEYEVRRQFGAPADLSAFARRFPRQAEKLRRLVAEAQALASGSPNLHDSEVTLVPRRPDRPGPEVSTSKMISASKTTTGNHPAPPQPVPPPATPEPLPEVFGHYRILKVLGKGGMGAVYLAHDTKLDRRVALKVPYFSPDDGPEVLERFRREAQAAATLSHPHLCPVHEYGEIDGRPYLTMAYIDGKSLSDFITSGKPLPQRQVAAVVRKLAQALQEAHAHGVIHRDLKPSNVRINQRHEPIVIDFGLARRVNKGDVRLTETGSMLGSPAYMAPEQVAGDVDAVGPGCDIYSLGVILYELLTGRLPFQGTVGEVYAQIMTEEPAPPSAHRPDLEPQLDVICRKAMAKKVTARYTSMGEMAAALTSYLRSSSQTPVPPDPPAQRIPKKVAPPPRKQLRSASRRLRPPTWGLIAAAGAAAVLLLGIVILVQTDEGTVKIELSDPTANVKVEVDGKTVDIMGLKQLQLRIGNHKLVVTGKDFEIFTDSFTVRRWNNPVVQVPLLPKSDKRITNSIGMQLVLIPPGKFLMGSPDNDNLRRDDEKPQHEVEITSAFYLGKYEVTRGQFRKFIEDTGYQTEAEKDGQGGWGYDAATNEFKGRSTKYSWQNVGFGPTDEHPVVNVTWNDAVAFCVWLGDKEGKKYRLPTEAEWEYSCRARTETRYHSGDVDDETLGSVANVADASFKRKFPATQETVITTDDGYVFTAPVGRFKSNDFGLHDMHGNVCEWCQDWYDPAYYKSSPKQDPQGPSAGSFRVLRGGAFLFGAGGGRAASRGRYVPANRSHFVGFRVVLVP